ncbi:hypothetical protein GN244_ATG08687 [Phytophthora infestans]|uniref:Uncharacterized protein n=1 Tax=Phytophthora infestans TaxID=4787 RepID=A0A833TA00_PHYIN|nr:hypothetical protein GN244_ATG08687 [Phytophthora infestans]
MKSSKYFRCNLLTLHNYLADLDEVAVNEDDYPSDEDINFFEDESDFLSPILAVTQAATKATPRATSKAMLTAKLSLVLNLASKRVIFFKL